MPSISAKITRAPGLRGIRFTRSEMREIGEAVRVVEVARFYRGEKPDGSPAAPLTKGYAISKAKRTGRRSVRDWRFKNDLPAQLRTTVSSPEAAVIKFPASVVRVAQRREMQDDMFSLSAAGERAGSEVAAKYLDKALARAVASAAR